jgi:hypothetical protein
MGAYVTSAKFAGPDREPAHKERMKEIAMLFTANNPDRLIKMLTDISFEVASAQSVDASWPKRTMLNDSLVAIEVSSLKAIDALRHHAARGFLEADTSNPPEYDLDRLANWLSQSALNARRARNSPDHIAPDGTLRRGAGKTLLPGKKSAKYVCAAATSELWALLHDGNWPGNFF